MLMGLLAAAASGSLALLLQHCCRSVGLLQELPDSLTLLQRTAAIVDTLEPAYTTPATAAAATTLEAAAAVRAADVRTAKATQCGVTAGACVLHMCWMGLQVVLTHLVGQVILAALESSCAVIHSRACQPLLLLYGRSILGAAATGVCGGGMYTWCACTCCNCWCCGQLDQAQCPVGMDPGCLSWLGANRQPHKRFCRIG